MSMKMSFSIDGKQVPIADLLYPVGAIYINTVNVNPGTYLGGVWERFGNGKTLVGVNEGETEFATVEKTGGNKNMQQHTHTASTNSTGGHTHQFKGWVYLASTATTYRCVSHVQTSDPWAVPPSMASAGAHTHTVSVGNSGTGNAQNLQPYVTVYFWKRVG